MPNFDDYYPFDEGPLRVAATAMTRPHPELQCQASALTDDVHGVTAYAVEAPRDPGGDTRPAFEVSATGRPEEYLDGITRRSVGKEPGEYRRTE